ncbi:MAG TPA: hypothetical protein VNJ09_11460 [Chthonomonadales bacterium]|nr:hypothetical protein [Chthonomonadales bacterium]
MGGEKEETMIHVLKFCSPGSLNGFSEPMTRPGVFGQSSRRLAEAVTQTNRRSTSRSVFRRELLVIGIDRGWPKSPWTGMATTVRIHDKF